MTWPNSLERTLRLLANPAAKFVDDTYRHREGLTPIKRLVEQGVELTGYDVERHEWVAPTLANLAKGLEIVGRLYDSIQRKNYSSVEELKRDVAAIHWWGDQLTPYKRGSAGVFEFVTKYIFISKGYLPSHWKPDVIPYVEAVTSPLSEYVDRYSSLFDGSVAK